MVSSPSTRTWPWEWLQAGLLAVNLAWTTLCLGGYRPETMVVTTALTGALLAVHLLSRVLDHGEPAHDAGWLLLPFVIYAAANVAWVTPVPWIGWRDWTGWAQMAAIFWVALNGLTTAKARRCVMLALVVVAAVSVAMACYQRFVNHSWMMLHRTQAEQFAGRASGSFGIPNSFAALLLLFIPPLLAASWRKTWPLWARVLAGLAATWLGLGLLLSVSRGAWLGLIFALVAWPLCSGRLSWWKRLGLALGVLGGCAAAITVLYKTVPTVHQRLDAFVHDSGERTRPIMWRGAWEIFREHRVVGGGGGSYDTLFEAHRPESFQDTPQWSHNDYLNTLADYGAVGFVLFFGAVGLILIRSWRGAAEPSEDAWLAPAAGIGLLAFALQLFVDFHLKIPALAMAAATVAGLVVRERWPMAAATLRTPDLLRRGLAAVVMLGVILGVARGILPLYRAEALRYTARETIDRVHKGGDNDTADGRRAKLATARADLVRAVQLDPANAQAWADLALADEQLAALEPARHAELGASALIAAEAALRHCDVLAEYWIRAGVALDLQGKWYAGGERFTQAVNLASNRSSTWYFYAHHMSLAPQWVALAKSSVETSLRLDPGNRDAIELRERLAAGRAP